MLRLRMFYQWRRNVQFTNTLNHVQEVKNLMKEFLIII